MPDVHERKAIRDAVAAQLVAASTSVGTRVFTSRYAPFQLDECPAIRVTTEEELTDTEKSKTSPRQLSRTVTVKITGFLVAAEADMADALDALALEIEAAMDADRFLSNSDGATARDSMLKSSATEVGTSGDKLMGAVVLEYTADYRSPKRTQPPADNFNTAHSTITKVGPDKPLNGPGDTPPQDHITDIYAGS
jgi:hypothetical protein